MQTSFQRNWIWQNRSFACEWEKFDQRVYNAFLSIVSADLPLSLSLFLFALASEKFRKWRSVLDKYKQIAYRHNEYTYIFTQPYLRDDVS